MKLNDDARNQSYFGFSIAMLIQMLLTLIILIIVSTLYLSQSDNANDHLLLEIIIYIFYFFFHCMRIIHSLMGGKHLYVYLYGFVYALISIVLLAFALFKTSEIRVSFAEEKRRKIEEGRVPTLRLSGVFSINAPSRVQSGYGSDTSYVTAREYPIQ